MNDIRNMKSYQEHEVSKPCPFCGEPCRIVTWCWTVYENPTDEQWVSTKILYPQCDCLKLNLEIANGQVYVMGTDDEVNK